GGPLEVRRLEGSPLDSAADDAPNPPVNAVQFCNQPLIGAVSKVNSQAACHRRAVPAGHRSQIQRSLAYATSCRNPYYRAAWRNALPQPRTAPESQTIPGAAVSNTCSSNPAVNLTPLPPEFHRACV